MWVCTVLRLLFKIFLQILNTVWPSYVEYENCKDTQLTIILLIILSPVFDICKNIFTLEANIMKPDQSDLGPQCLPYSLHKYKQMRKQTTFVVNGGERFNCKSANE